MVLGKDLPVGHEEWVALRHAVRWPAKGDYVQIMREYLFHISARWNGRLVGFLPVVGSPHGDLLIHSLCVHPDVQGQGVGTMLMDIALEACRDLNPQGVNVLFETKDCSFFEKFGFRVMQGGYMDSESLQASKVSSKALKNSSAE
jgi:N-acetylglutamate synthase-like GNAT family acetyltransferase